MLNTFPLDGPIWLDLLNADAAEQDMAIKTTGLRIPQRDALSEIESSSRLSTQGDAIYLSMPVAGRTESGELVTSPLGIVLTPRHLVTIRYQALPSFDHFIASPQCQGATTSIEILIFLLEALVDRLADVLEHIGTDLDELSRLAFRSDGPDGPPPAKADKMLRDTLRLVGQAAEKTSRIRDSLLGVGRIAPYVTEAGSIWIAKEMQHRFKTLRQDVVSLSDYDVQLTNKVQFLLDATLGFINIEQNTIIKTLTVVSVVGIPPTLVAGIYGMNFKNMPEYDWAWGYQYGWLVLILSALLPLALFKWRGWM